VTKSAAALALRSAGIAPRGLSREQAAAYVGISAVLFDTMVKAGTMPKARRINSRAVWDRSELDDYFTRLPHDGEGQDVDDIWGQARA